MIKQLCILSAITAFTGTLVAQGNLVPIPPHASVYNGYSRGYSFTANTDFFIQALELPTDAFQAGDTAGVVVRVNGTTAFFTAGNAAALMTPPGPIQIFTGDVVDVVGNWSPAVPGTFTAHNSYGSAAPFATTIEGVAHTLDRTGVQNDIANPAWVQGTGYLAPTSGSIGRVLMYTTPPTGLFASFTATPTTGASPLTVQFTDTSFTSDPGGVLVWEWDFENDGIIDSFVQNPTHIYTTCGSFDVSLRVTDAAHPQSTTVITGLINTDLVEASFTVAPIAPNVWQFTDTSVPPPTAWAWDFDNDGIVDDTSQNPAYVSSGSCLNLPACTLTVTLQCNTDTVTQPVFAAGNVFLGETAGGNGLSSATSIGNYFDIQVTNPEGINVCGLSVAPYTFSGLFDCNIYITGGTHVGKEGNAALWRLAGSGQGVSAGGPFANPILSDVGMSPFYLPPGDYGAAVFLSLPGGGTVNLAYTNAPGIAPYVGADMAFHPNGVGSVSTSELGPVAIAGRLFNGGFYYNLCSVTQEAATGFYGGGCSGALGTPAIVANSLPQLGSTYSLDVTNIPAPGIGIMGIGFSKDTFGGLPLPLDLGIIGAPGCNLLMSGDIIATLVTATSTANWSFAVPNNPTFACFTFYNQAAILDATANTLGFSFSSAQAAVVGN